MCCVHNTVLQMLSRLDNSAMDCQRTGSYKGISCTVNRHAGLRRVYHTHERLTVINLYHCFWAYHYLRGWCYVKAHTDSMAHIQPIYQKVHYTRPSPLGLTNMNIFVDRAGEDKDNEYVHKQTSWASIYCSVSQGGPIKCIGAVGWGATGITINDGVQNGGWLSSGQADICQEGLSHCTIRLRWQ